MIDIVIVNYNSTDHLMRCLQSIEKQGGRIKTAIYVMDNASTDGIDRIPDLFPQVTLIKNQSNWGFARAVNQGLKLGRGNYVVLLNPDTYITEEFFETALEFMENNPDVGIMGPKILDMDGMLQNSARGFPTPLTAFFGRSSFFSRRFPKNPITSRNLLSLKSDGRTPMRVDWVSGACMVVRRKAIEAAGLLDERFFMYWEDADWCRRMWGCGWEIIYFPLVSVYHYVGGSSEKKAVRSVVEFHKSVFFLFDKYLDDSLWFLKPLVLGGLSIRLFFVLISHLLGWILDIPKDYDRDQDTIRSVPDRRIRILRVISRLNVGGPSIHVYLLTKGLNPEKFYSRLVTGRISSQEGDMSYLFKPGDPQPIIIPDLQREIRIKMDIKAFWRLFSILSAEKPDIVHTHTAKAGSSARLAVIFYNMIGRHKVLMVHTFHGHIFEGYFSDLNSFLFLNIERLLARASDAIIAISDTQKEDLIHTYRIAPANKIKTIELGFDLTPFLSPKKQQGEFRKKIGVKEDDLLVGIIGRLVPIKNHYMFFDAARRFLELAPGIQVWFIIVGDGELRDHLMLYCKKLGIENSVKFCGWIRDVSVVYNDLDILALTSLNEGTPVSIIESMASSVPVIATDAGGVRDLLGTGGLEPQPGNFCVCERGILCRKNDPEGFARGLIFLLREDKVELRHRIQKARSFVENHFSRHRLIHDMETLYHEIMVKKI